MTILITTATILHVYESGTTTKEVEIIEQPLWDVVKAELFEKFVENTLWLPAMWIDNTWWKLHKGRPDFDDPKSSWNSQVPLDIRLELKSYDLHYHNKRRRLLGRVKVTDELKEETSRYTKGRKRR